MHSINKQESVLKYETNELKFSGLQKTAVIVSTTFVKNRKRVDLQSKVVPRDKVSKINYASDTLVMELCKLNNNTKLVYMIT